MTERDAKMLADGLDALAKTAPKESERWLLSRSAAALRTAAAPVAGDSSQTIKLREVIADVLRLGIIGDIEGAPEIVALDIIEHIERRGFSICALPTQPAREASETCQTCMGSGYSNHPDSGEVCQTCGGQGEQPAREEVREALEAETSRADENSISCMAFINVLRNIIRNSPDAYAVKVAEEAIKMPWLAQSPKAPAGKVDFA